MGLSGNWLFAIINTLSGIIDGPVKGCTLEQSKIFNKESTNAKFNCIILNSILTIFNDTFRPLVSLPCWKIIAKQNTYVFNSV